MSKYNSCRLKTEIIYMPQISVIIPVYNGENTIRETIESVLNQTFSDFELIVINDGSQDSTLDILSSIQDPRLQVFSYPNVGVSVSRNRGLSHAGGEFIAFLDADDLWTPDKLEAQLKTLQQNPQAAAAYSWLDHIDESGQFLRIGCRTNVTGDVYPEFLVCQFLENVSAALIRTQALLEVGGFDESLTHAEDWELLLRLAARYHFVSVPSTHILYRTSTKSATANLDRMETEFLKVLERAYSQAPESLQHLKNQALEIFYKYVIYRAFEVFPGRQKGWKAANLLWHYLKSDRTRHRRLRSKLSLLSKILTTILRPAHQPQMEW